MGRRRIQRGVYAQLASSIVNHRDIISRCFDLNPFTSNRDIPKRCFYLTAQNGEAAMLAWRMLAERGGSSGR
jgi:hypothetical protein